MAQAREAQRREVAHARRLTIWKDRCRLLGVGPTTFWKWVKRGGIRPVRVGPNITMIPTAELRDFLKRNASLTPEYSEGAE